MARGKRPQKSQGSTKGKRAFMLRGPNRELVMDEAEGMIARRMKPAEMREKLGKAHGLNGKQGELWVTAVNKRWAQAGGHEPDRKGRRQEYARRASGGCRQARSRRGRARSHSGALAAPPRPSCGCAIASARPGRPR